MHLDGNRWNFTRKFAAKKGQSRFLKRLDEARSYFPELDGHTVKVGITINADGKADLKGRAVYFRSRNVSFYVMGHELTHLLQEIKGLPKSERSCDLYTMARRVEFCDEAPNYVKVPRGMLDEKGFIQKQYQTFVHDSAKRAVSLRESGMRRYILWFEKALEEVWKKDEPGERMSSEMQLKTELLIQTKLEDFLGSG
ncbi:MAG: hypothetical protein JSV56_11850 [Methanomassiliicoccales archaeon]|nr:MAG: hypothetical protein JSV56_11850 [Methanomassiliicoccales archaeon]